MPGKPAARVFDETAHGFPLFPPGPGSPDVFIGFQQAWRGVPLAASAALEVSETAAQTAMTTAEAATAAAAGTPAGPAAYTAEQALKSELEISMSAEMESFAGMADIHICEMLVPLPIHGPGVVIDGSPTVLINNMPACRLGDTVLEALGGPDPIVTGCYTVLIGDSGGTGQSWMPGMAVPLVNFCDEISQLSQDPQQRLLEEQAMLQQLQQSGQTTTASQLQNSMNTLEMAMLSQATYSPNNPLPPGWSPVTDPNTLKKLNLSQEDLGDDAFVYQKNTPGQPTQYAVAFRGTQSGSDWMTNLTQGLGFEDDRYDNAENLANKLKLDQQNGVPVEITGHSKGGGEAAYASAISGYSAKTFNAAGVHQNSFARAGLSSDQTQQASQNVQSYVNSRDPLNGMQDNRGILLPGLFGALGIVADATGGLPQSFGQRQEVPAYDGQGINPLTGHSMDAMIKSLEQQQDAMLNQLFGCP
jgi:hypothetical protein